MPVLSPTEIVGRVAFLGVNPDRDGGLESTPRDHVRVTWDGFEGEAHGGLTRPSCSRVKAQYERGTEIRNTRQIAAVSVEELAAIAETMGIARIDPGWIGSNIALDGIPDFTLVPPSSRLLFEGGVSLAVDMENGPCRYSGQAILARDPAAGDEFAFSRAAKARRGVCLWVEKPGEIAMGEACRLHIPPQRIYAAAE